MAAPARSAVFLCQGGGTKAGSLEYKRLRWTAEANAQGVPVFEIIQACQAEGVNAIIRMVQEHNLSSFILGACPLAGAAGPLAQQMLAAGMDPEAVVHLDLCQLPEGERDICQVSGEAQALLCQALAAQAGRQEVELEVREVCTRVLVLGEGLAALLTARVLVDSDFQVLLLTQGKRLTPPEPLLGKKASELAQDLAVMIKTSDQVRHVAQGDLISLSGETGDFSAHIRDREGRYLKAPVGAVVMAQGPPLAPNQGPWAQAASGRLITLSELHQLIASPEHFKKKFPWGQVLRVGLLLGLEREANPLNLRAACAAGQALIEDLGARVCLVYGNLKVASGGLEEVTQQARAAGMLFFKVSGFGFRLEPGDGAVRLVVYDEALGGEVTQECDLLAIDQVPAPDAQYLSLAAKLGLAPGSDGYMQPDLVNALPTRSSKGGVFVLGAARGWADAQELGDEVLATLGGIRDLLHQGRVEVPVERVLVDRRRCAICLTCVRVCPEGAMGRRDRRPVPNPLVCTACGTCASECPMDAIQIINDDDTRFSKEIKAALIKPSFQEVPQLSREVLVFACANSAGQALRSARLAGSKLPPGLRIVQVPCAGKVDPVFVLEALGQGYDGVVILSCFEGACYSLRGTEWAGYRVSHLRGLLTEAGHDPRRLVAASLAPNMQTEFVERLHQIVKALDQLGPSPLKLGSQVQSFTRQFTQKLDETFTILP
ncbi:MAG: hydrogenase iron-sulfur subunit [Desulfarculaceae bacterium]|jgi:heterodisulfide reductase subunit A-like polyferredoxin/coenzyme F420-reducing hydrogenase delta subunit